jgi:hypothetical protein
MTYKITRIVIDNNLATMRRVVGNQLVEYSQLNIKNLKSILFCQEQYIINGYFHDTPANIIDIIYENINFLNKQFKKFKI